MTRTQPLILIIEDEAPLKGYLRAILQSRDYRVEEAATLAEGRQTALRISPDLVLLDLGVPTGDTLDFARDLRTWSRVPIIVVCARGQAEDRIQALDSGADDYLTRPFVIGEFLARIRVTLRHSAEVAEASPRKVFEAGPLHFDFASREVAVDGVPVHLSPTAFSLLAALVRQAGKVLTHNQLLQEVWGGKPAAKPGYLRVYMAGLRKKLEPDPAHPRLLMTEPGIGYRLKV